MFVTRCCCAGQSCPVPATMAAAVAEGRSLLVVKPILPEASTTGVGRSAASAGGALSSVQEQARSTSASDDFEEVRSHVLTLRNKGDVKHAPSRVLRYERDRSKSIPATRLYLASRALVSRTIFRVTRRTAHNILLSCFFERFVSAR